MAQAFAQRSRRGQTLILRALALSALPQFGLSGALRLLGERRNTLFRLSTLHGDFVVRVQQPGRPPSGLETEARWLLSLAQEPQLQVLPPLPTLEGAYWVIQGHPELPEGRAVSVFPWQSGPSLDKKLTPERVSQLARLQRSLHQHSRERPALGLGAPPMHDLTGGLPDVLGGPALPPQLTLWVAAARRRVEALFARYASRPQQLCHMDLHPGNVLITPQGLLPIDFEECGLTWPEMDLGATAFYLNSHGFHDEGVGLVLALRGGYGETFPDPDDLRGFMMARQLLLLNEVLQDPDPGWPARLPGFLQQVEARLRRWLAQDQQSKSS